MMYPVKSFSLSLLGISIVFKFVIVYGVWGTTNWVRLIFLAQKKSRERRQKLLVMYGCAFVYIDLSRLLQVISSDGAMMCFGILCEE
mmetsp:Transcript_18078/g.32775  ORF Transcript_18078/g.32775 Transcript_18078/m.32775 type:complete len:87 (+) Transcript_18078:750-1010(+)